MLHPIRAVRNAFAALIAEIREVKSAIRSMGGQPTNVTTTTPDLTGVTDDLAQIRKCVEFLCKVEQHKFDRAGVRTNFSC